MYFVNILATKCRRDWDMNEWENALLMHQKRHAKEKKKKKCGSTKWRHLPATSATLRYLSGNFMVNWLLHCKPTMTMTWVSLVCIENTQVDETISCKWIAVRDRCGSGRCAIGRAIRAIRRAGRSGNKKLAWQLNYIRSLLQLKCATITVYLAVKCTYRDIQQHIQAGGSNI